MAPRHLKLKFPASTLTAVIVLPRMKYLFFSKVFEVQTSLCKWVSEESCLTIAEKQRWEELWELQHFTALRTKICHKELW